MLHVLAVASEARSLPAPASIEIVWAHDAEDAAEKLARNRRIDAVVFFEEDAARATVEILASEGGTPPPLFRAGPTAIDGIPALDPAALFDDLRRHLGE